MFKKMSTAALLALTFAIATPAFAQAPTEAQRDAIKSDCRSDYIAHCSSIPPGGAASLECLQKNMASLSASCAAAVHAVEPPAAATAAPPSAPPATTAKPDTESKPAAATAEPAKPAAATPAPAAAPKAASTAAKQPTSAQIAAVKSNCRADYPKVCASVPPGGAAALECLDKNKAKLSAACGKAVAAVAGAGGAAPAAAAGSATANAAPAGAAAAPPPPPLVLRMMRPREELFVLRSARAADVQTLCAGVVQGGGRIMQCLASQAASLSPACRDILQRFATQ